MTGFTQQYLDAIEGAKKDFIDRIRAGLKSLSEAGYKGEISLSETETGIPTKAKYRYLDGEIEESSPSGAPLSNVTLEAVPFERYRNTFLAVINRNIKKALDELKPD